MACPDGSYGSLFAHALGTVTTWAIDGAELTLTTSDGGTGTFVDAATALGDRRRDGDGAVDSESDAIGIPVPRADTEPDASRRRARRRRPRPRRQPARRLPHPGGDRGTDCGPDGCADRHADRDASTDSDTDRGADRHVQADPDTDAKPPTPAPTPTPAPGGDLVGTSWQLTSFTTRDPVAGGDVPAAERSKYTVSFAAGGTFSANADCNVLTGTWTATAAGGLSIVPGASAIVACGDGSNGDLYILALTNSASYAIANNRLTITLQDGGTLVYEPAS